MASSQSAVINKEPRPHVLFHSRSRCTTHLSLQGAEDTSPFSRMRRRLVSLRINTVSHHTVLVVYVECLTICSGVRDSRILKRIIGETEHCPAATSTHQLISSPNSTQRSIRYLNTSTHQLTKLNSKVHGSVPGHTHHGLSYGTRTQCPRELDCISCDSEASRGR